MRANALAATGQIDPKTRPMKTVVYLDQPFVSNLWKSTKESYRIDPNWAELYNVLLRKLKMDETAKTDTSMSSQAWCRLRNGRI
jgi:hypothetical protein